MIKPIKTRYEKFGDVYFPVVEINGMTIIDYPSKPPQINKNEISNN